MITQEYPPEVYGGAGVHVAELVKALRRRSTSRSGPSARPRDEAGRRPATPSSPSSPARTRALTTLGVDLAIAQDVAGADLVHSHTWYANAAGHLAQLLHGIPHVVTAHSLEPLRPWKAEQLGGGYRVSSWIEKTAFEAADAVIAVSEGMRRDILRSYPPSTSRKVRVVHNGIDLERWQRVDDPELVRGLGIDPDRPSVVFVGRITRQKGLPYLLRAAEAAARRGAARAVRRRARHPRDPRRGAGRRRASCRRSAPASSGSNAPAAATSSPPCFERRDHVRLPVVYEPLGIVNLEAMACGAPVVGTATGRHPRGRRRRRHRPPRADRAGAGRHRHPARPRAVRRRPRRDAHRGRRPTRRWPALMGAAGRLAAEAEFSWARIADADASQIYRRPARTRLVAPWPRFCSSPMSPSSETARRSSTRVTWTVDSDERWVVLGPNGAGKTTLLQVAAAQIHPTLGRAPRCSTTTSAASTCSTCARASASPRPRSPGACPPNEKVARRRADRRLLGHRSLERGVRRRRRAPRPPRAGRVEARPPRRAHVRHLSDGEQKRVQIARR